MFEAIAAEMELMRGLQLAGRKLLVRTGSMRSGISFPSRRSHLNPVGSDGTPADKSFR